jgi:hypothetical protein
MQVSAIEDGGGAEVRNLHTPPFTPQEIKMNVAIKAAATLVFILAVPLFAFPAQGTAAYKAGHKPPPHHRAADFANAQALVSPAKHGWPAAETDGLSRNDEECSRGGCIDH